MTLIIKRYLVEVALWNWSGSYCRCSGSRLCRRCSRSRSLSRRRRRSCCSSRRGTASRRSSCCPSRRSSASRSLSRRRRRSRCPSRRGTASRRSSCCPSRRSSASRGHRCAWRCVGRLLICVTFGTLRPRHPVRQSCDKSEHTGREQCRYSSKSDSP